MSRITALSLSLATLLATSFGTVRAADMVRLPEGTPVRLAVAEHLSSATATVGQRFNLSLDEDLRVGNQLVAPRGANAVGTVMAAHARGHMGKAGELNVQVNYLLAGDQRIALRGSSGQEGHDKVGATVALTVLFGPLGLLKRGKDIEIGPGTVVTAYVDNTTLLPVLDPSSVAPAPEAAMPAAPATTTPAPAPTH